MQRATMLLLATAVVVAPPAHAGRHARNGLLRVVAPPVGAAAPAHPFVNVIVRFGRAGNGAAADPATFRAHLGHREITKLFTEIVEDDVVVGKRAALEPPLVHVGRGAANRLHLTVQALPPARGNGHGRRLRDVDRIRFRAVEAEDQPPVARAVADSDVILPGVALQLDATQSHDPESDPLNYRWDFGDGTTAEGPRPEHTFAGGTGTVTVRLTVDDGQLTASDQVRLCDVPPLDPGRTPGTLRLEAAGPLEFGAVPPGASAVRSFTVRNTDLADTSQLRVRLCTDEPGFAPAPTELELGPGASASATLTFAPAVPGHQAGDVAVVGSTATPRAVHLLVHGYGGAAPGTGPTLAADPVFYNDFALGPLGILPSGARFTADNRVHACQTPGGGGSGDVCVTDADCASAGESCAQDSTASFDPVGLCADGEGGVYLMSDDGTFTDPSPGNTELDVSVLHLEFDAAGARTGAEIFARTTTTTTQIACDAVPAGAGGRAYLAEFRNVTAGPDCRRDGREALVALRKRNGADSVLMPRIDAAEKLGDCDNLDPVTTLEVARDGSAAFAIFSNANTSIYEIWPKPRPVLAGITGVNDPFQVHPDGGAILYVTATNTATTGLLSLYKVSLEQAEPGVPPRVEDLTPCATFQVPSNQGSILLGEASFAAGRAAPGSPDGTVLVSFGSLAASDVLSRSLRIQGTVAFTSPAGAAACSVLGLVNLELLELMTF